MYKKGMMNTAMQQICRIVQFNRLSALLIIRYKNIWIVAFFLASCLSIHSQTWQSIGPDGGAIFTLSIDPVNPSTIYAGTERGGVFKSTDSGSTWRAINNGLPSINPFVVSSLVVDPKTSGTLYVASVDGVFKSTDGGTNWGVAISGLTDTNVTVLAIDPIITSTLYVGTGSGVVFKSVDKAGTWSPLGLNNTSIAALAIDPVTSTTIYAAGSGGVFSSSDGGAHWSTANTGLPNVGANALVIDPSSPNVLYAGTPFGGVFKSANGGGNWAPANAGLTNNGTFALAIDSLVPTILYTSNNDGVFKTTNGGQTWTLISSSQGNTFFIRAFAVDRQNEGILYAGAFGQGVFKSADGGATWVPSSTGLSALDVFSLATDPTNSAILYAGFDEDVFQGVFKSADGGTSWGLINNGLTNASGLTLNAFSVAVDPKTPNTLYVGGELVAQAAIFKSINQGISWTAASAGLPQELLIRKLVVDPVTSTTVYALGSAGVSKSIDAGGHWASANVGLTDTNTNTLIADPSSAGILYVGTNRGGVFKSTDSAASWVATGLSNTRITALGIDPRNPNILYAASFGNFFKSTDGGNSWTAINTGIPLSFISSIAIDPASSAVYAATEAFGVFQSTDGGNSWTAINNGLTNKSVTALIINPNSGTLYAGTEGGGAFVLSQVTQTSGTISVSTNNKDATFTITDGNDHTFSGSGTSFTQSAPAGAYTITYGGVPGFNSPLPETKNLSPGGTVTFNGLYTAQPPVLTLTVGKLDFGSQVIGTQSTAKNIQLQNTGGGILIPQIAISGDYLESNNCSDGLAFGATCQVAVTFAPRGPATRSGQASFSNGNDFHNVELTGFGAIGFPLKGSSAGVDLHWSPGTALLNSVFDHSMQDNNGYHIYGCDKQVIDFIDEIGNKTKDVLSGCHAGYSQPGNQTFQVNGNYSGGKFLYYDGHPGIDYQSSFGNQVYAALSGTVKYPTLSELNADHITIGGDPDNFSVLELDAPDGLRIFYLHLSSHPRSIGVHLTSSLENQNFTGKLDSRFSTDVKIGGNSDHGGNFSISGKINFVDVASGTMHVAVQLLGKTVGTKAKPSACVSAVIEADKAGNYNFTGLPEGFYNVRPIKNGFIFNSDAHHVIADEGAITAGNQIAESGNAGVCFAPHLHFEVQRPTAAPIKNHVTTKIVSALNFIPVDPYGWHPCTPGIADPYFLIPDLVAAGLMNETLWMTPPDASKLCAAH
jgi:photosystem II stability/assembly factor-like uncharacterized protein